jgi:MMPL family
VRDAVGQIPGAHVYVTGYPAINHDTKPLYTKISRRDDRDPDRVGRAGVHVRDARRDPGADRVRADHDPDHARRGSTVAVGLALLAFMPLPFIRSMGIGGLLVPLVSIVASATLLPALLSLLGRRVNSLRIVPKRVLERRAASEAGFWTRLARTIMRYPIQDLAADRGLDPDLPVRRAVRAVDGLRGVPALPDA